MAENFYDNSFFPSLSVKSPDIVGALSGGYDLGRKMYVNQQLPGLMQQAAQGDTNAQATAQALDPSAAYQAALGNQAQSTVQQQKLLTVARLSNGLKSALDNSADDTAKQSAIDAFDNLAKQSGLPENPMLSDPNVSMDKKVAWVNNTAQQTQSTMMGGILGKGIGSAYVQSLVAQGVPMQTALAMEQQQTARLVTDPNGNIYQPSPQGPVQFNPTAGTRSVLGGQPQPQTSSGPSSPALNSPPPASPASLPIDGATPAVPISADPINSPKPTISGLASLNQQDQGSIPIPQKPTDNIAPPIEQAKQVSLQTPGKPVDLPNGGFMMNGKYFDSIAKTNPAQEQKTFDKNVEGYVDPKDGLDAQIKAAQGQINLAKQIQSLSPNADSGQLADYFKNAGGTLESLGILPNGSKAPQDEVIKAITGQYAAGIMGGENNVKNVRNVREFDTVMSQAPMLTQTAAGREKIAALTEAVAQAKLQSAQQYQQAVSDRSIQDSDVKKQLQNSYGQALDSIPVYGISHYDDPKYADKVRQSLEIGTPKQEIINRINALAPK